MEKLLEKTPPQHGMPKNNESEFTVAPHVAKKEIFNSIN
jgi:hypothetical protein